MSQAVRQRRSLARAQARPSTTSAAPARQLNPEEEQERLERERIAKRRRKLRRLDELERTNYRDGPSRGSGSAQLAAVLAARRDEDSPDDFAIGSPAPGTANRKDEKRRANAEVKRILGTRKGLHTLLDEATERGDFRNAPNYMTMAAPPSRYPVRPVCSVCGYWGKAACIRCQERYCGLACKTTHDETRCEKPLR